MILVFSVAVFAALVTRLFVVYSKSHQLIIQEAEDHGVSTAKFFESRIGSGYEKETSGGDNPIYQQDISNFQEALPSILEINLYNLNMQTAVASSDHEHIRKKAAPANLETAYNNETIVILERDPYLVADVTAHLEIYRGDEIGTLAWLINVFTYKLRIIFVKLQTSSRENKEMCTHLAVNTTETAAAAEKIAGTTKAMNDRTEFLYNDIDRSKGSV